MTAFSMMLQAVIAALMALVPVDSLARDDGDSECRKIPEIGYRITAPGKYCLTEDIEPRLHFADHRAPTWLIWIRSSNVELDMGGHALGRFLPFFAGHGGGLLFDVGVRNVVVRNGTLRNLGNCVIADPDRKPYHRRRRLEPRVDSNGTLSFPLFGFRFENVSFRSCGTQFAIDEMVPDPQSTPPR